MKTEITYHLEVLVEHESPYRHFASGNDERDRESVEWILEHLESGNAYAWFCAKVTARVETEHYVFTSEPQYLGCCSYESRADFIDDGGSGYYSDLCAEALGSLQHELEESAAKGEIADKVLIETFGAKKD
jgi:hypothetical protein